MSDNVIHFPSPPPEGIAPEIDELADAAMVLSQRDAPLTD